MLTPHEAKLYLAEQLLERIEVFENKKFFYWKGSTTFGMFPVVILETEWQQIALWIEEKMTDEQHHKYRVKLWHSVSHHEDDFKGYLQARAYLSANYTLRATAMKESGL
jgi:hypothetical protein